MILDQIYRETTPQVNPTLRELMSSAAHHGARKLFELFHIAPKQPEFIETELVPMPADEALYALERHAVIAQQLNRTEPSSDYMAAFEALNANFKRHISGEMIESEMDEAIAAVESFTTEYDKWTSDVAEEGLIQGIKDKYKQFSDRRISKQEMRQGVKKIESQPFEQIVGEFLEAALTDPAFERGKAGANKLTESYNDPDYKPYPGFKLEKYQDLYYIIDDSSSLQGKMVVLPLVKPEPNDEWYIAFFNCHQMAQYIYTYRQVRTEGAQEGFIKDLVRINKELKEKKNVIEKYRNVPYSEKAKVIAQEVLERKSGYSGTKSKPMLKNSVENGGWLSEFHDYNVTYDSVSGLWYALILEKDQSNALLLMMSNQCMDPSADDDNKELYWSKREIDEAYARIMIEEGKSAPASEGFLDIFKKSPSVKDMVKNNTLQAEVDGVTIRINNDNMREIDSGLIKKMDKALSLIKSAKKELAVSLFEDYGNGGSMNLDGHLEAAGIKNPKDIEHDLKLIGVQFYICEPNDVIKELFIVAEFNFICDAIDHDHIFSMENYYDPKVDGACKDARIRCLYTKNG